MIVLPSVRIQRFTHDRSRAHCVIRLSLNCCVYAIEIDSVLAAGRSVHVPISLLLLLTRGSN